MESKTRQQPQELTMMMMMIYDKSIPSLVKIKNEDAFLSM